MKLTNAQIKATDKLLCKLADATHDMPEIPHYMEGVAKALSFSITKNAVISKKDRMVVHKTAVRCATLHREWAKLARQLEAVYDRVEATLDVGEE